MKPPVESVEVSRWFWTNFHYRGFFSLMNRARKLRHIPMPKTGGERAWIEAFYSQVLCCFSTQWAFACAKVITDHCNECLVGRASGGDAWMEANAPSGCISPLGTSAAADAIGVLIDDFHRAGKWRGVVFPFMRATGREVLCLLMMLFVFPALPFASWFIPLWLTGKHPDPFFLLPATLWSLWGFFQSKRLFHSLL